MIGPPRPSALARGGYDCGARLWSSQTRKQTTWKCRGILSRVRVVPAISKSSLARIKSQPSHVSPALGLLQTFVMLLCSRP